MLVIIYNIFAEDLSIQAYVNKTKIGLQDKLTYTIEISGENSDRVSKPELPTMKGFRNLGCSTSSSSSMSYINGRMERSSTYSYNFTLQPREKGNFTIPSIEMKFKRKKYRTPNIKVTVVQGSTQPPPPTSRNLRQTQNNRSSQNDNISDNLFIKLDLNKTTVYKGEPIIAQYRLYKRYDIRNLSFIEEPAYTDFWKEELYVAQNASFKRINYKGKLFEVMSLRNLALYPTATGSLTIPSQGLNISLVTRARSFFDFDSGKETTIRSKTRKIKVLPLPEKGKPSNFTGAVGTYKMSSNISGTEMKVGDSFTFTIKIEGSGNIKYFENPILPKINHFRFIDPEITTEMNNSKTNVYGTKIIKYLAIAQEEGTFTLPSIKFSYFDTQKKRYKTLKTKEYTLDISPGNLSYIPTGRAQSSVTREGLDIGFIIKETSLKPFKLLYNSVSYWIYWLLIILSIPISYIYIKEKEKRAGNFDYLRQQQANKILKKYLKQASNFANEGKIDFYAAAQTGLFSYISDKLKIPRGSTTNDIILEMKKFDYNDKLINEISNINDKCNQARFMPGGFSNEKISEDYNNLKSVINEIFKVKNRRKKV